MLSASDILQKARDRGYAIGAFNAGNLETVKAIVQAAVNLRSPVIIESSSGETKYFGPENLVDVVNNYRQEYGIPILINLDHAKSVEACRIGIDAGYDLVHIDASEMDYEENVKATKAVVELAGDRVLVEGEIDHIQGSSTVHNEAVEGVQAEGKYTDPDQAVDFVRRTGIDTLASFVGNVHGVYKNPPKLDIERLRKIAESVDCWLSLHGGSGIPDDQIKAAIGAGIVKINVNTELRMAYKSVLFETLQESEELAIYKLTPEAIEAVQKVVEKKIELFGSAGKA